MTDLIMSKTAGQVKAVAKMKCSRRERRKDPEVRLWENYLARQRYAGVITPVGELKTAWQLSRYVKPSECVSVSHDIPLCVCAPSLPEWCTCSADDRECTPPLQSSVSICKEWMSETGFLAMLDARSAGCRAYMPGPCLECTLGLECTF